MRLTRASRLVTVVVLAGACAHNDVVEVITRDGSNTIAAIDLQAATTTNAPTGTRAVNRFISSGPFDTSVTNAFALSSSTLANLRTDAICYGSDSLVRPWFGTTPATFTAPPLLLPAIVGSAQTISLFGCGPLARIVPVGNTGNGAGNVVWEVWYHFNQLQASTRYVMGFARYRLVQRGALDASEMRLTGAVAQPDTLVFDGFNPGGRKDDVYFGAGTTCNIAAGVIQPIAGANPHFLGGGATDGTGEADFDQTICANAASVWGARNTVKSPIPRNNAVTIGASQYNFFVVWEALPDSTPNYAKPVWREQIGPVQTQAGAPINNASAPLAGLLTNLQLGGLPGATSRPDTMRLTFNTLKPLSSGAYQVWLLRTDSSKSQLVTGRVVRLNGTTVVDTLNNVSEFNTSLVITGARVEFDVGNFPQGFWNAATLAVAGSTGNTILPASQPLWTTSVAKPSGQVAQLTGTLAFGSFHSGSSPLLFGAAGAATGGVFGNELREDITRMARPPVGYMYEAWLTNSGDTTKIANLGPILKPYPDLAPFVGADTAQTGAASGVEITEAAIRYVAGSTAFYCAYDRVQVRLAPKNGNPSLLSRTLVLSPSTTKKGLGVSGCP